MADQDSKKTMASLQVEAAPPEKKKKDAMSPMTSMSERIFDNRGESTKRLAVDVEPSSEDDGGPTEEDLVSGSQSYEAIAMSGQDMPGLSGSAKLMVSPSRKMSQKLKKQEPNQLYKFSRVWVQAAIPLLILFCIALFIWSNLSVGASVMVSITIPKTAKNIISFTENIPPAGAEALVSEALVSNTTTISLPPADEWVPETRVATICIFTSQPMRCLGDAIVKSISKSVDGSGIATDSALEENAVQFPIFNFTLTTAVQKMWEGKAYALAILIAALSGAWPYIKLVSMFILWFVPIRPSVRETLLSLLEALGKWSLIDVYVFALMMAGFRFSLNVGAIAVIKIAIQARWGLFSFCIGVILSHLLSHLMMFVHHNAQAAYMKLPESKRHFSLSSVARFRHRKLNTFGQVTIALLILGALCFTVASVIIPTFKFDFNGLLGMLLPTEDQVKEFSLIQAGVYIPSILEGLSLSTRIGEWFVVVVYYAFALVTPILKVLSCLVLWSVPLTTHQKEAAKSVTSMLGTWSALDVFFVSVIAAIIEIGNLTSSIMGEACDNMKNIIGIECLRLEASFLPGAWCMGVAVVFSLIVSRLILSSTSAHFRRVAMLHLWTLKKKYFESFDEKETKEKEQKHDRDMMGRITAELYRTNLSSKFANLLAGSVHESQFNLDGLSPEDAQRAPSQPQLY